MVLRKAAYERKSVENISEKLILDFIWENVITSIGWINMPDKKAR